MFFFKNDDGFVSIHLYPAHTDHRHPNEDFIFWKLNLNPARLLEERFQKHCWRAFMAYMEVTSIDGAPSLCQKVLVWYYRHFKHVVIDKKELPLRYISFLKKVIMWVLTIGFSGLVIFLLQVWLSPNPSEHQNIKEIRKSVVQSEAMMENIQKGVFDIKASQDTLIEVLNKSLEKRHQENVVEQ